MSTAIPAYFEALQTRLADLARAEAQALSRAADLCAEALAARQVLHLYDTGHLISHEMVARTGGLVAFTALSFRGVLENHNRYRAGQPATPSPEEALAAERALLDWVFAQGSLRRGDVLVIGSVSGTALRVVELAEQARWRGLTVIAVTAPAHSSRLAPEHPGGKRLFEVADVVLDNHAGYGDSFFSLEGFARPICPFSGLGAAALLWALTAGIVERLVAHGLEPSIYTSVHLPGGPAAVAEIEAAYARKGY